MVHKRKPYKTFTREFKLEALRQLEASTRPATELARELGIRPNQLYKWRDKLIREKDDAFPGSAGHVNRGRPKKEDQSELTTLKQKFKLLEEENEILKKAAAYFARELK
jgi:transposase